MPKITYTGEDGRTIATFDEDNDKLLDGEGKKISLKELKQKLRDSLKRDKNANNK
jgi:hypothetical protein